jgi:8-oxo-dGTP pyrophosphatase MutT (NUDIX family)
MEATPATPRPAATVILLRRGGRHVQRAVEVLMVRRTLEASFMPGVWVFPGGVVEGSEATGGVEAAGADAEETAHRACAIRELAEEAGIELAPDAELIPWSRWITPEMVPMRFDTRFYVALAPPHSPPRADGTETIEAGWFAPADALERTRADDMSIAFPTVKHLESLEGYADADAVLAAARERVVEPILPRVVGEGDARRIVIPGEPPQAPREADR